MSSQVVASYTPVIIKGAIFTPIFTFTDGDGAPSVISSASFDVAPNGAASFSWTQGNGKFLNTDVGVFQLALDEADTAALTWTAGRYRISVVEGGETNPCIIEGLIFAKEC